MCAFLAEQKNKEVVIRPRMIRMMMTRFESAACFFSAFLYDIFFVSWHKARPFIYLFLSSCNWLELCVNTFYLFSNFAYNITNIFANTFVLRFWTAGNKMECDF